MMRPGVIAVGLVLGLSLALPPSLANARGSLWEDVAHPNRRRCAQLLEEANRRKENDTQAALAAARKAVEACPDEREVLQTAGKLLLAAHEYVEGRQRLERARALSERTPAPREQELELALHLGFAREVSGDLEGAIEEHRRLEAMGGLPSPNQYLVHYDLGDELMATGRLSEAIDEYRRAATLAPDKPVVRLALAVALDRDEQLDKSRFELSGALTIDPQLKALAAKEYVFVPPADVHYYRALALLERGASAEARLAFRAFLVELPDGPYSAHARQRLAQAEKRVDPRELEVSVSGLQTAALAHAIGPLVGSLEDCFGAGKVVRIRLFVAAAGLRAEPDHPAAECLDRTLSRVDNTILRKLPGGSVLVPLAGRRAAASAP
jgi:tetratricopeptide (TPR) repeat protein